MAGDWIQMRHDLAEDPAVIQIAAGCKLDVDCVVGKLHRFWSWADNQTTNGRAKGITGEVVDTLVGHQGFSEILQKVGWLTVTPEGIRVPKFNRYMSQSAKQRALTARRVAKHRALHP